MSIDATLKEHYRFLHKQLPWYVILGDNLEYGVYETNGSDYAAFEVYTTQKPTDKCVVYRYNNKGRGIYIDFGKYPRTCQVNITLPLPSTEDEIVEYFEMLKRISEYWNCDIELDDQVFGREDITEDLIYYYIQFNEQTINDYCKKIIDGELDNPVFPCVTYPLCMGEKEANEFYNNHKAFYQWMNDMQSLDYYYATPKFFNKENDDDLVGQFMIVPDLDTIFPYKPHPAFYIDNIPSVANCKDYVMVRYLEKSFKKADYNEFIDSIPEDKKVNFDEEHFIITLTEDEIMDIYRRIEEKHKIEL